MKLEQQVVSLELSKRLKELLSDKTFRSYFYWQIPNENNNIISNIDIVHYPTSVYHIYYPAYTVAELGEILPRVIVDKEIGHTHSLIIHKTIGDGWCISYKDIELFVEKTEADARAKMLIYLLENNLIEIK